MCLKGTPAYLASKPACARLVMLALILAAFGLRLPGFFGNSFTADEALFATWARLIAVWRDPLLLTQAVDKPPLAFYAQALFYPLFGPVEWAARLPNLIASILLVPLTGRLVSRWYGNRETAVSVIAALFVALSPYAIQFASTAFLDPLLVTLLTASLAARKPGQSGFLFGLALMTKFQAVLFLPLILPLGGQQRHQTGLKRWLAGFLPVLFLLLAWDVLRTGSLSLWLAQMTSYGGLRLAWSWELLPRLHQWLALGRLFFGTAALSGLFCLGVILLLWPGKRGRAVRVKRNLAAYGLGYLLFHWLLAVPVWDRYLLPLLPLVAVLVGQILGRFKFADLVMDLSQDERLAIWRNGLGLAARILLIFLMTALLLSSAWNAAHGCFAIGGSAAADAGARDIAAFLADAPYGTVLYDHWYSWQWRYHLFEKGVYVSWVAHPAALAQDLAVFGRNGQPRYLALPSGAEACPFQRAVQEAGFQLTPVSSSGTIVLYAIAE